MPEVWRPILGQLHTLKGHACLKDLHFLSALEFKSVQIMTHMKSRHLRFTFQPPLGTRQSGNHWMKDIYPAQRCSKTEVRTDGANIFEDLWLQEEGFIWPDLCFWGSLTSKTEVRPDAQNHPCSQIIPRYYLTTRGRLHASEQTPPPPPHTQKHGELNLRLSYQ